MTFEEFFKKKKINLALLQGSKPALFAELKTHYEQMGEKSFDHTKKYWFNQLRHQFPAPVEAKAEKVIIENKLAEQTITQSLADLEAPAPPAGFKPRFKAVMATKPAEEKTGIEPPKEQLQNDTEPKPTGFKPRFKASMVSKPVQETNEPEETAAPVEAKLADTPKTPGFKPRFKAGMVSKANNETATPKEEPDDDR